MEEGHRAAKKHCACIAPLCDSVREGKQAAMESTDEGQRVEQCEGEEAATRKQCVCMIPAIEGGSRNWADLAPHLLANILVLLPLDELILEIPFVCKAWKLASEYPLCWKKLDLLELPFAVSRIPPSLIERAVRHSQGHLLEINAPHLNDRHRLDLLACSAPLLQKLYIPESSANDEWATYAAPLLPNLKELDLSLCNVSYRALIAFGKNCRGITKVIWWKKGYYGKLPVDDGEALAIAQHYPLIKHLEFNANALSAYGLREIYDNCPSLTYLELDECPNVTRRGSNKKLLKLCRARYEHFGDPYDEYTLFEDYDDDDDDDDGYDDDDDDDSYDDDDDVEYFTL